MNFDEVDRVFNFSAGPATLPTAVLRDVQQELLGWNNLGTSVMEISHRSKPFMDLAQEIEQDLRELMSIPKNYKVLFVQGGGRLQFAMVPLNLLNGHASADYFDTGLWSQIAIAEAGKFCNVNQVCSADISGYTSIPDRSIWQLNPDAPYVHIAENETVHGIEFYAPPDVGDVPLVSDMSSCILSRPMDVSKYGLIYAGTQKNIAPAGMAIVIVREDLLGHAQDTVASYLNYQNHANANSLYNTPPTFTWYVAGKVFKWLLQMGGLNTIAEVNQRKADKLYAAIDQSDLFYCKIDPSCRSRMNVVFNLRDESLQDDFLAQAEQQGLVALNGHRKVGGLRASIYNAMPEAGVDKLVEFMSEFEWRV